jgi:hypothetical protein
MFDFICFDYVGAFMKPFEQPILRRWISFEKIRPFNKGF